MSEDRHGKVRLHRFLVIRTDNVDLVAVVDGLNNLSKDSPCVSLFQLAVGDDKVHNLRSWESKEDEMVVSVRSL